MTLQLSFDPDVANLPVYVYFINFLSICNINWMQVSADLMWQVFSPYGTVRKIVVINKDRLQAKPQA